MGCYSVYSQSVTRIDIRDRVRRLQKDPREEDRLEIERLRQALKVDLTHLRSIQSTSNETNSLEADNADDAEARLFDNLDDDAEQSEAEATIGSTESDHIVLIPPEHEELHLPSQSTNNHPLRVAELSLRIKQATRYLSAIREGVAEKSFQYSHVMHSAPSKGVRTRSRMAIAKVSDRIGHYSRIYCRARAAMVQLGADEATLNTFRLLSRDDVKASTAILNPNNPGSSALRLSWIWGIGGRTSSSTPDTMWECK